MNGNDICPNPPGSTTNRCVASAQLSRLKANAGAIQDGDEHVLVKNQYQVHPNHSISTITFGPNSTLYAGAKKSASFINTDYGQNFGSGDDTTPNNPCSDPPSPVRTALNPPSAKNNALRSQNVRTSSNPIGLSGTIIRVNPSTGAAMANNWFVDSDDPNMRQIMAYNLRNPFRFTFRPSTSELWISDVKTLS